MIPVFVAIGVVVAGLAMTTSYVVLVARKKDRNSDDMDFRCPECGAEVRRLVSRPFLCLKESLSQEETFDRYT